MTTPTAPSANPPMKRQKKSDLNSERIVGIWSRSAAATQHMAELLTRQIGIRRGAFKCFVNS